MSTIASPRPSITSFAPTDSSPTASIRSSLTLDRPKRTRDRAALRDYYNLKPSASHTEPSSSPSSTTPNINTNTTGTNEQDPSSNPLLAPLSHRASFNSTDYITSLLQTSTLPELLGVESALVAEVRGLDGERKALVYDNYSRLIAATAAIGKMRGEMEVEGEMKGVEMGVERVGVLVGEVGGERGSEGVVRDESDAEEDTAKDEKIKTVRYVLDTPRRLAVAVQEGRQDEAEADWAEVNELLEKWKSVKGVKEIRAKAIAALNP